MRKALPVLILLLAMGTARPVHSQELLNLSCMEALVSVGEEDLAGIFSFISEDDSTVAFADLAAHRRRVMRKYISKLNKDLRVAKGISTWDHQVVLRILQIYGSPLAEILKKPSGETMKYLQDLSLAPTLTLGELTARRRKKK